MISEARERESEKRGIANWFYARENEDSSEKVILNGANKIFRYQYQFPNCVKASSWAKRNAIVQSVVL